MVLFFSKQDTPNGHLLSRPFCVPGRECLSCSIQALSGGPSRADQLYSISEGEGQDIWATRKLCFVLLFQGYLTFSRVFKGKDVRNMGLEKLVILKPDLVS